MHAPILTPIILVMVGIGSLGIYLMLPMEHGFSTRLARRAGACFLGVSVIFLAAAFVRSAVSIQQSTIGQWSFTAAFTIFGCSSVSAAALTITSRLAKPSLLCFGVVLLANAGCFLLAGGHWPAAAMLIVVGGAVVLERRGSLDRVSEFPSSTAAGPDCHEPLLACVAGAILAACLIGAIRFSIVDAGDESTRSARFAAPPTLETASRNGAVGKGSNAHEMPNAVSSKERLGEYFVLSAVLFALGAVGFLSRRHRVVSVLSIGIMLQAALLVLVAKSASLHIWSGQGFSLLILALFTAYVACAIAWAGRLHEWPVGGEADPAEELEDVCNQLSHDMSAEVDDG